MEGLWMIVACMWALALWWQLNRIADALEKKQ